jgi:hypothetical protein
VLFGQIRQQFRQPVGIRLNASTKATPAPRSARDAATNIASTVLPQPPLRDVIVRIMPSYIYCLIAFWKVTVL